VQELSRSPHARDALIPVGQSRAHPGTYPRRLGAVWWHGTWSRSLTHVLDPPGLSAPQVCERSRRRWRIEDALAWTNRRVAVASGWTGSTPAVPWQIDATRVCSAVLVTRGQQVAQALGDPLERSSVEMVCRAFSHDRRTVPHGGRDALVAFLAEQAKRLGIVKRWRKQHRERQALEAIIWGDPSVETGGWRTRPSRVMTAKRRSGTRPRVRSGRSLGRAPSVNFLWRGPRS
jgi:hypothetical protein